MPVMRNPRSSSHLAHLLDESSFRQSLDSTVEENGQGTSKSARDGLFRTHRTVNNELPLSVYLWENSDNYSQEALDSGFVQGIKNIQLKPSDFGGYLLQDSVFCYNAKSSIDKAIQRAPDPATKRFLEARAVSYTKEYEELFKTWRIKDPRGITLDESCLAYIDHEHDVATTYHPVYFIVALIPCAKLWPWLGQQLGVSPIVDFGVYTEWARANFDPDDSGVKKYESFINAAEKMGHIDRDTALNVYIGSMKGEADFFNSVIMS